MKKQSKLTNRNIYDLSRDYGIGFTSKGQEFYFDSEDGKYDWDWESVCDRNIVYFSSKEIAQKCCDWLNAEMEEE